ncbi:hypothetical protein AB4Z22_44855, partial [Paenibacillus sp. TAF58]
KQKRMSGNQFQRPFFIFIKGSSYSSGNLTTLSSERRDFIQTTADRGNGTLGWVNPDAQDYSLIEARQIFDFSPEQNSTCTKEGYTGVSVISITIRKFVDINHIN